MAIPEQIRKQSAAVQELYTQMHEGETGKPESDVKTEGTVAPIDKVQEVDDKSGNEDAGTPPLAEQTGGGESNEDDGLLQKYRTLQGMFNAEVPRLQSQLRQQSEKSQQLEQLIASMSVAKPKEVESAPAEKIVTEQDVADYGDSIDMMRRVSREELSVLDRRLGALEGAISQVQGVVPQVQAVAHRQAVSAEQAFWADLTRAVSNWREINDDQDFQTWLLQVDPLTGITRQAYLDDAQQSLDAHRVASFFSTWLETNTGNVNVAQTRSGANSELGRQVSPGKTKNSGPPQSNKGRNYTPADVQKFYEDVRKGEYRGRDEDRAKMERDIFAAQRENRIVNS